MASSSGLFGNGRWKLGARIARHDEVRERTLASEICRDHAAPASLSELEEWSHMS